MARVVVYGATGFTGRLIVRALLESGVTDVALVGRSGERLRELGRAHGGLAHAVADVHDRAALDAAFRGARVVVAAAGPFSGFGEPVVAAAIGAGAHVLDTAGEQPYLAEVHRRFDAEACAARRVVVSGHAFEFALGCCAGALAAEAPGVTLVDVFYRVAARGLSQGTKRSIVGVLGAPRLLRWCAGRLQPLGLLPPWSRVAWPGRDRRLHALAIPGGEALQLPLGRPSLEAVATHLVGSFAALLPLAVAWGARPMLRALRALGLLSPLGRLLGGGREGPSDAARRSQRFQILARGSGAGARSEIVVSGVDAYGMTAHIAALGAKRLLDGEPLCVGVVSTDRAFGARSFLDALAPHGLGVTDLHRDASAAPP